MNQADRNYAQALQWKLDGGAKLSVFVSDGTWLGGAHEARPHQAFVAIGPDDWEDEQELTFFKSRSDVDAFIGQLRAVSDTAFADD